MHNTAEVAVEVMVALVAEVMVAAAAAGIAAAARVADIHHEVPDAVIPRGAEAPPGTPEVPVLAVARMADRVEDAPGAAGVGPDIRGPVP